MTGSPGGSGELWTELRRAVDEAGAGAVRRVGRRSTAWLRAVTGRGRTRAAAVHDLVGTIARLAQSLEGQERGVPPAPRRDDVLTDQLAVVTYDLLAALDATPAEAAARQALAAYEATTAEID